MVSTTSGVVPPEAITFPYTQDEKAIKSVKDFQKWRAKLAKDYQKKEAKSAKDYQKKLAKDYQRTGKYVAYKDGVRVYGPDREGAPPRWEVEDKPPCVLYAFDGTGNDMFTTSWIEADGSAPSNIEIMFRLYRGRKRYAAGVGTNENTKVGLIAGNLFGAGIEARYKEMLRMFRKDYKINPEIKIHIIGFSRGAAAARGFAHKICEEYNVKVEFLGIFDTVAQEGAPDLDNENDSMELRLHKNVEYTCHAIAKNEYRELFPLTSLTDNYYPHKKGQTNAHKLTVTEALKNFPIRRWYTPSHYKEVETSRFIERPYNGAHSDIGGGYTDYRNLDCLKWIIQSAFDRNAPLAMLSSYKDEKKVHDIPKKLIDGENGNYHGKREDHIEGVGHDSRAQLYYITDKVRKKLSFGRSDKLRIIFSQDYEVPKDTTWFKRSQHKLKRNRLKSPW